MSTNPAVQQRVHQDVEYAVDRHGEETICQAFAEAAESAIIEAMSAGRSQIDVLIWSEDGAQFFGGDDAAENYRDDPDASVFERIELRVTMQGRVP